MINIDDIRVAVRKYLFRRSDEGGEVLPFNLFNWLFIVQLLEEASYGQKQGAGYVSP